jgi:putative transposase
VKRRAPPRIALSEQEREEVLAVLHAPQFVDASPYQIYPAILDQGVYLCSIRTMYRLLEAHGELRERRNQRRHPTYTRPELLATGPNQLWTWDITLLRGPVKYTYFYLYVIIDVFSRYVPGWMIANRECGDLAGELIEQSCHKQAIRPGELTIHADNGAAMTAKSVRQLMADLDVARSHSRPRRSNDNPFSEAHFKTLKYRPSYPERFGSIEDARAFCRGFFTWYNKEHYHSGIALLNPEALHYGRAAEIIDQRNKVLLKAFEEFPHRFGGKPPRLFRTPGAVWINPPRITTDNNATLPKF